MMDHPHIAKVLDGGATETGRPFFVMELVRGIPLMAYCDQKRLTNQQRLSLFLDICGAIQHAHHKGIIHRDIKPTNILVSLHDGRPVPKVIDFGIAKATQGKLTDKTLFTRFEQLIGTPAYMSPEQAEMSGLDIDTRSDIYSLGVLLYELLTGQTPFDLEDLANAGCDEIRRKIREVEPPTPSTRLSSLQQDALSKVAQNRHNDPAHLSAQLRGDLDLIVLKAMEKDRTRRYETASALAEDIHRYLRREPVLAVPPSAMYRFRKFASRNGRLLVIVGVLASTVLLGTGISIWQAIRATKATVIAQAQTKRAIAAEEDAVDQRKRAVESEQAALAGERQARQIAYASDMARADQALRLNNLGLARTLVDRNRAFPDGTDLRNWEWRALWLQCQGEVAKVIGDRVGFFSSMDISPEGNLLALSCQPGGLRIQDASTGEAYHEFPTITPKFVAFAPKGDRLYAVSYRGEVSSWSLPAFSESEVKMRHGSHVRDVCISTDGTRLAMFGFDQQVTVWDLQSPNSAATPIRLDAGTDDWMGPVEGRIVISPDNKLLAIGLFRQTRILDLDTLDELRVLPHGGKHALAFSPTGQYLAIGTRVTDSTVYLYRVADGKLIAPLGGHASFIHDVEFSSDGRLLASASADHTIRVWDTETQTQVAALRGHTAEVGCVEFIEGSERLMSGSMNGEIYQWNPHQRGPADWPITAPTAVQSSSCYSSASFSPDGKHLATRNQDDTVSLRSAETLEVVRNLAEVGKGNRGVRFSPVEPLLAAGDENGNLSILALERPDAIQNFELVGGADISPISFTRDGKRLLVVAREKAQNYCIIWSIPGEQEIRRWIIPSDDIGVAFSPSGEFVATEHDDRTTRIWKVADPVKPIARRHESFGGGIAFAPDGKTLLTTGQYASLDILDSDTFTPIGQLQGHMLPFNAVTFSLDGTRVATGGPPAKVWDVATRQELMSLAVEGYFFDHVAFSPDGNAILTISGDGTLNLWRVPTFDEIQAAEAQLDGVARN